MEAMNETSEAEFVLLGLTEVPELQVLLFFLFLLIYAFTVVCNISISTLVIMVSKLHTPMYFFLCNLSVSDVCCSSVIVPKMLRDLLSEKKSITFVGCAAQTFFFIMFAGFGVYMLSAMAYDRYAAICHPLLYSQIMCRSVCILLVTIVYSSGVILSTSFTGCVFRASFCGSNVIDHFFCDVPPLLRLSTSDRFNAEIFLFAVFIFFGFGSLLITVTSYIYIVSAIMKIPSTAGRRKTFSTCGSHLTCLSFIYLTGSFNYLTIPGSGSSTLNKAVSVFYSVVPPLLNPLIYSLRNQEMKGALWSVMRTKCYYYKVTN